MEMGFVPGVTVRSRVSRQRTVACEQKGKGVKTAGGFRILELGIPFGELVKAARFGWGTAWRILMNELAPSGPEGDYVRPVAQLRWTEETRRLYPVATERFTIYAGVACPWCHRVLLARTIFGLEEAIDVEWLSPGDGGLWQLQKPERDLTTVKDVYLAGDNVYKGRYTAPALRDNKSGRIICNESLDIVYMMTEDFKGTKKVEGGNSLTELIQSDINNGVYMAGFAKTQAAYERAIHALVKALDRVETVLEEQTFLSGNDAPGLEDILLFPTVYRFENVYSPLFRCHSRSIRADYPQILDWARAMYQWPGVSTISDIQTTEQNYYGNLFPLNPSGIIPLGPTVDFSVRSERDSFVKASM